MFIIASLSTFYGTRLTLPIVTYYGRGALTILPATLTFAIPLFTFILLWIYSRTGSTVKRWKMTLVYSFVMLGVSVFNTVIIFVIVGLLYDWNFIVGVMTPMYPLDLLLYNLIYLAIGGAALFFTLAKKKENNNDIIDETKKTPRRYQVLAGFFFAFACYFFGEALFGLNNLFEGYIDPNIGLTIPVYLSFLLMALAVVIYAIYIYSPEDKKNKRGLLGAISILSITALIFIWILIGFAINPYYFSESLQQEFAIGYAVKIPFGLFILLLWVLIPSVIALIKILKKMERLKKESKS